MVRLFAGGPGAAALYRNRIGRLAAMRDTP